LRVLIVVGWVAAAVACTVALPNIGEAQTGALGDLVPNDADALDAELRSTELFRFPLLSRTLVVQRDPDGLSAVEQARVVERARALAQEQLPGLERIGGALPIVNTLGRPPFSRESSTTAVTYLFFSPAVGPGERARLAERFVEQSVTPGIGDAFVGITGALGAREAQAELITDRLPLVELATVLLVLFVVGLHFRAVGAPLANLAAVAVAYLVSVRVIAVIAQGLGVSVPREVEPVIVVLLFGVVTDYSIFFLSRVRRRLAGGEDAATATARGSAELLPIIVTAGLTVVGASASLVVAELGFFQAFGPGMAMAVLIGLLVSVTFVPALLALGGRWLFWPRTPGDDAGGEGEGRERRGRRRAVGLATRRPLPVAVACTLLLALASLGLLGLNVGNPLIRGLPEGSPPRVAYAAASEGFTPGVLSPTVLVVEGEGIVRERSELARLQRLLERQPGVAEVVGPADQPAARPLGATLSQTGDAARFFVVFDSDPLGAGAIESLRALRGRFDRLKAAAGLPRARASVAGDTALIAETIDDTTADLGRIAPVALSVVLLILVVFLRALVAPLYLVAASVLALLASLGLATIVFQELLGYGELTYYVPFAAAVLLVSLGSDYNVFLVGAVWTEARRRPLREAVAVAGAQAATPITIAGLVLAASFAMLALVPIRPFRELAFTVAVGLAIDAFLVRTMLVPALMTLIGPLSGWPGQRLRRPS
jgi:RND superfamily putative drug exporter